MLVTNVVPRLIHYAHYAEFYDLTLDQPKDSKSTVITTTPQRLLARNVSKDSIYFVLHDPLYPFVKSKS
jgi:hypothetical protein